MKLLLDLGNTRLKWAYSAAGTTSTSTSSALAHATPDWLEALAQRLRERPVPLAIWLAAVASEDRVLALQGRLATLFPTASQHRVRSPASAAGITNAYVEPERLGVDRFLAMVAARARASGPLVVAGCGTAIAVDLVDATGRHHGGAIAPSAWRMREAVLSSTARVFAHPQSTPAVLGTSTEQGLDAGCWLAAAALVDRLTAHAAELFGAMPTLLLHGGDADRIAALLQQPAVEAPDLVLEGLARWAAESR
jgi:type III pantothenate kinase